ncbi:MAG: hypothetical protein HOE48_05185 [Candidatus Latescibacteria bacterium]|jgi:hypothetical protein|nr:hypothetical protein [Candidatus Latescibacterota bacterium]MBT4137285.1 hypothetical protein [Candidatus Latescibacterota bacterium]
MKDLHSINCVTRKVFIFFLFVGCGAIPNDPEPEIEQEMQNPLLVLPEAFQEIPLTTVRSTTLENTFFGTYYAPPKAAQYFEYKNGFISGHILKYDDLLEARLQHRNAMATLDLGGVTISSQNNTHTLWEGQRPHTYFYLDSCAVHFTLDTQQQGYTYDPENHNQQLLIREKSNEFGRQFRTLNRQSTPTPFYVELDFDRETIQPSIGTPLPGGTNIPFKTNLKYTLTDSDVGQIILKIRQHHPEMVTEKIIPITKGRGSIAYSDTLHPTGTSQAGTSISITATLHPSYLGNESPSIFRFGQQTERLPDGQFRVTAVDSINYPIQ